MLEVDAGRLGDVGELDVRSGRRADGEQQEAEALPKPARSGSRRIAGTHLNLRLLAIPFVSWMTTR